MSANLDPMVYPLFFRGVMLVGIINWFTTLNVLHWLEIMLHYLSITIINFQLDNFFLHSFMAKKLFQQYAVDVYVKIEGQRLAFIRNNQNKLRSKQYVLHEHVNNLGNDHNVRPGRVVVLPSTYVGSPRALKENFEDAMAIIKKYGKPDLFITFTCNPKWRRRTENLYPEIYIQIRQQMKDLTWLFEYLNSN